MNNKNTYLISSSTVFYECIICSHGWNTAADVFKSIKTRYRYINDKCKKKYFSYKKENIETSFAHLLNKYRDEGWDNLL